ncbi:hypothetical protein CLOSYM_04662 [[Clostridium] symbiosum ATCC 14940]|uniref:Uncharacterized protein n=1 Tax=[Clostridium] symbiosum ATCC 14940 TaxID=411472 RepID=A0ABC9TR62_CLOSY|nr:hypothetical protein CLOSYM_04662 [[Clostridium] symbiosum ATCC 14940]
MLDCFVFLLHSNNIISVIFFQYDTCIFVNIFQFSLKVLYYSLLASIFQWFYMHYAQSFSIDRIVSFEIILHYLNAPKRGRPYGLTI